MPLVPPVRSPADETIAIANAKRNDAETHACRSSRKPWVVAARGEDAASSVLPTGGRSASRAAGVADAIRQPRARQRAPRRPSAAGGSP